MISKLGILLLVKSSMLSVGFLFMVETVGFEVLK